VGTEENVPFFSNHPVDWDNNPEMLAAYQDILQFYAGSEVARSDLGTSYLHDNVFCLQKTGNGEELLIIVNARNQAINFPVPAPLINSSWVDVFTDQDITLEDQVFLTSYKYLIMKR
jgi:hypothetical protein